MITWTSSDASSFVDIYLYKGSQVHLTIALSVENESSYNWTLASSLKAGSNYKIEIVDSGNGAISDQSNDALTITQVEISSTEGGSTGGGSICCANFAGDYVGTLEIEIAVDEIGLLDASTSVEVEIREDGIMYLTILDVTLDGVIDSGGNWTSNAAINDFGSLIDENSKAVLIEEGCSFTDKFVEFEGQVTPPDLSGDVSGQLPCAEASLKITGTLGGSK